MFDKGLVEWNGNTRIDGHQTDKENESKAAQTGHH